MLTRSRWRKRLIVLSCLLAVFGLWHLIAWRVYEGAKRALLAEGLPVTGEQLNAWYDSRADSVEGGQRLLGVLDRTPERPWGFDYRHLYVSESCSDACGGCVDIVRKALREHTAFMDDLRAMPSGVYRHPMDLSDGPETLLPTIGGTGACVWWLTVESGVAFADGRLDAAFDSLDAATRLSMSLKDNPVMIGLLVQLATTGMIIEHVQVLIQEQAFSADELRRLMLTLEQLHDSLVVSSALVGEKVMIHDALSKVHPVDEHKSKGINLTLSYGVPGHLYGMSGWKHIDLAYNLGLYHQLIEADLDGDSFSWRKWDRYVEAELEVPSRYPLSGTDLKIAMNAAMVRFQGTRLKLRVLRAALGVEHFRVREGRYPTEFHELCNDRHDAWCIDPMSVLHLYLEQDKARLRLYSEYFDPEKVWVGYELILKKEAR